MIEHALKYAELGLSILPVDSATKAPLTRHGASDASNNRADVSAWWTRYPDAAIGVHAGKSRLVIIDVDPRNGGKETLREIEAKVGPLWDQTPVMARSGGGGSHYLFRDLGQGQELPSKLGPGVDLLHGNRYFIVPPSLHPSGQRYEWENGATPFDIRGLDDLPEIGPDLASPLAGQFARADSLADIDPSVPATDENRETTLSALRAIDPDCGRDDYLRVLFALHSTGWPDAIELAQAWASGEMHGRRAEKYKERDFARDVRRLRNDKRRIVTLGTLFHIAKAHGWKLPGAADTFGDIDNGTRFARAHLGRFLFVRASGVWHQYDGQRWLRCALGEEKRAAHQTLREALDDASAALAENPNDKTQANHRAALGAYRNERRADALLNVAAVQSGMSIADPAGFDANPYFIGVRNGVVDLKSGTLITAVPQMMISKQAAAHFDRAATCPKWLAFLSDVFFNNSEMVEFMQQACGYALTGLVIEEKLFFMYGAGANGKSVFANIINEILGEYAVTLRSVALARDPKGHGNEAEREKARLPGARVVLINEVAANDIFDDQRVKEIVSRERISARHLYAEPFDFMPTHKIFIRGNHQPGAMDASDGFWRRIILVPFKRQFSEGERIADLDQRIIEEERNGIFMWILDGCLKWQREGLKIPESVKTASDTYRRETDILGDWLETCCEERPDSETSSSVLFESYREYLKSLNVSAPSAKVFGRQLGDRKFKSRRSNGRTIYAGIALREWGESS